MSQYSEKPNIILIEADQMANFVLPFYSDKGQAITPNLTKLAEEGVLFDNCYSNSPLCCPSRACMFSGAKTSHNKVWGNGSEFHSDVPTMMHFLKDAGYRTVVSGKTHFIGADQLHGFDKRLTTDIYPADFSWTIDWKPEVEHRIGTSVKKLQDSGLCGTNNQILYDTEVQFRAVEYLRYEAIRKEDSPFFMHVSYTQPHEAYQSVPKFWDLYEDIDIAMPEQAADPDGQAHPVTDWLKIHHGIDQFAPTEEKIRDSRRAYYAMITQIDEYVGELVAELKHLGLYDDTVIVFTSDHGDMMGERGMWFKRTFYEKSVKVPLIFHSPKRFTPLKTDAVVSLIDLCPTLSEIGYGDEELKTLGNNDSHSYLGVLKQDGSTRKDEAKIEYFGPGVEEPWLAIRRGEWKYVYTRNFDSLLFRISEDEYERNNLAVNDEYRGLVKELHEALFEGVDVEALTEEAVKSKQTRLFLHRVMKGSEGYKWSYQPNFDANTQYVRGSNDPAFCEYAGKR